MLCRKVVALMLAAFPLAACGSVAASPGNTTQSPAAADTTYYVRPSGNDSAAGTSPSTAWRTLSRVNSEKLKPGDRVLLQGGQQFSGKLILTKTDAGDASDPVVIGSYGSGRASIVTGGNAGILVYDTAGIDVENLVIASTSSPRATGVGINVYSDLTNGQRLTHVTIDDVDVSGFVYGIGIGGATTGFRGVRVENSALHGNLDDGLVSYAGTFTSADPQYANEDIYISRVHAYDNPGDPEDKTKNTGNGIVLGNVKYATISYSTADDNGGKGAASEGPVGIWAYNSSNVVIDHNLSYGNKTSNEADGDGFGLDENTTDCSLEYNLSYDNAGAGYLLYSAQAHSQQKGNVVRFNVSSRDGQTSDYYGGITLLGKISDTSIYQNTVVMKARAGTTNPALRLVGTMSGITVRDNIFATQRGGPIVAASTALAATAATLRANDYFAASGSWKLAWGAATYTSLAAWRSATGQELNGSKATGFDVNPQLAGSVFQLEVTSADDTRLGAAFELRSTSPLRGAHIGAE